MTERLDAHCAHCRLPGVLHRYRMVGVGVRLLDAVCAARLTALGMDITPA